MNDKDDKFSSDFEDDLDGKKNAEDEFVDHFDDDEPHFGEKASSAKEKDEFDEFDEHHEQDEFSTEEPEEYESEIKEETEEGTTRGKGVIDYLKNNAIFLAIGGFFIVTGVIRLYTMFAGAPPEQQTQIQGQNQSLQFAQKNQKPATTPAKEANETKVTPAEQSKEVKKSEAVATTGMPENTQTNPAAQAQPSPFAQTPPSAQPINNNPAPAGVATMPSIATANSSTVPSQPNPGVPPVLTTSPVVTTSTTQAEQTPTSPNTTTTKTTTTETVVATPSTPIEVTETESVETNGKNKQGSKISAFFANGKPVSEKEFKQINEKIATLEKKLKELTSLEDKLTRVQTPGGSSSDLTDLKNQLIQTNKIVTELSNQVRAQQLNNNPQMGLGMNENVQELPPRGLLASPQPVRDVIVQAVIPGRAWLKDLKGRLITVQVGDDIPGYGTVVSIDAHRGIVTTSEHFEFRAL